MAYLKRTNLFQKILFSRGMALAIIFAVIFVGYGLISIIGKSIDASHARKIAESQAAALTQKQDALSKKLATLDTDSGKETVLKEQFPVVKQGEHVVVISDADDQAAAPDSAESPTGSSGAAATPNSSQKSGFWNFLKNLFK